MENDETLEPEEAPQRAAADSWQRSPMPPQRARLKYEKTFRAEEFAQIQLGLIPQQMEDKWFIYWEEPWLRFHRSWTGLCIYEVRLEEADGVCSVTEAWANRDPEQYTETDDGYDAQILDFLIVGLLLGQPAEFPMPPSLSGEVAEVYRHSLVGYSRPSSEPACPGESSGAEPPPTKSSLREFFLTLLRRFRK